MKPSIRHGLIALACLLASASALAVGKPDAVGTLASSLPRTATELNPLLRTVIVVTLISLVPALLIAMTSFTRIIITLSFLRHALGMPDTPPNAVLITLALILTLFTMSPTIEAARVQGIQPFLDGKATIEKAGPLAIKPFHEFMLAHVREEDFQTMVDISKSGEVDRTADAPLTLLVPAFMLSELRAAFIAGFMIFLPFLLVDLVVATLLMAMGMMMVPPVTISLPLKLLLFVMIDGWSLIVRAIVGSYAT
jgi:flagellar biosynthetic protein FliP